MSHDGLSRPEGLADLLAEREPERQARRLRTWIRAAAGRPPLGRDPALAAAVTARADAVCAALARALAATAPPAALACAHDARRALAELRALLYVALREGALHKVQFDLLSRQAGAASRSLGEVALRARALCLMLGRPAASGARSQSKVEGRRLATFDV
jgi:hypothetical protein